jgi:cyclomaltodextrinase / maltogenic alpha-amylase / neopullulanase
MLLRMKYFTLLISIITFPQSLFSQTMPTPFNKPPDWSKTAIWYQIFVERFYNADKKNDPALKNITVPTQMEPPKDWSITPWTQNWFGQQLWEKKLQKPFNETIQFRRYGGDLQGVINKLGYLQQLGVNAIFLNPINDAPSLHKYDARNYHHVDVNFGPDPEGDNKIIAAENPADPTTWKWTSADKLFLKLVEECHKRNMKIIMDYSWNHTGIMFWAWQDIVKNQQQSAYKDWFDIKSFEDPNTPQSEFAYAGWLGNQSLPEIKKVDITTERKVGHPYEGNINEGAKQHQFAVAKRWLAPNGDASKGIDGFRLDVADQVGLGFWRDFRKYVRNINPDTYLVGEIWWQQWPDELMDPVPYTNGDVFDAVMFYQAYRPARYFFAKNDSEINAAQLKDSLLFQWNRLQKDNLQAMMNVSSSHDAPRLLSDFYNPNKYKFKSTPNDDAHYKTGKPDGETYKRLRLYLVHLFTTVGAPQLWNGEEMGMWGADDPHDRKPLMWKEFTFENETRNNYQPGKKQYDKVAFNQQQFDWYKKLIAIRKNNPVLATGEIEFIISEGKKLGYKRFDGKNEVIVLFNMEDTVQEFELFPPGNFVDLITGKKYEGRKKISLMPLSVVVLKK